MKEDIILKSPQASTIFKFKLTTNGLVLKESENAVALFNAAGEEIFTFAPLFMEDANGKRSDNVSLSYTSVKNGYELTISADTEFLQASDTAYPVIIDPSVMVTGSDVTYDTCVDEEYPNSNYYLSESLWTGGALGTNAMRTYLKFSIPTYISANQVSSAYVYLLQKDHQPPTIRAYRVSGSWTSSAITWNSKPPFSSFDYSGVAINTVGNWYGLDVTTLIRGWLSAEYSYYGFVLKEPSETSSSQKTKFYSSDAPSPNKPELVITYSENVTDGLDAFYGFRPYQETSLRYVNCMGYALEYASYINYQDLGIVPEELTGKTVAELESYIANKSEDWMDVNIESENWDTIDTYNSGINPDWYRVVLRVGFDDKNGNGVLDNNYDETDSRYEQYDYHWWYQTDTGDWADKRGGLPSEYHSETKDWNPAKLQWVNGTVTYSSNGVFYQIRDMRTVAW